MEDERVWQVPETERELALLEKLAEGRQVLAWALDPELVAPLARRARALIYTPFVEIVRGLPARSFSLIVFGTPPGADELEIARRLSSPAALFVALADEHLEADSLAVFQRVGRLRVASAVTALPSAPATVRP